MRWACLLDYLHGRPWLLCLCVEERHVREAHLLCSPRRRRRQQLGGSLPAGAGAAQVHGGGEPDQWRARPERQHGAAAVLPPRP